MREPRLPWRAGLAALALCCSIPLGVAATGDSSLIKQLDSEVIALRQRIKMLEKHCGNDQPPPLFYAELSQVFQGTPVTVGRRGSRALLTFRVDDLLVADSMTVREEIQPLLDLLATSLTVNPSTNAIIIGHTDGSPAPLALRARYPTAWDWSLAAAHALGDQLVRRYGVQPSRLTMAARAQWEPVAGSDTPEGRASNRRVVIQLFEGTYL
ncbi:MAG: hypothetical protein EXR71_19835 [Myxococcales bacterium]|nr:hypothetical protein [Myxococcales bacterium]